MTNYRLFDSQLFDNQALREFTAVIFRCYLCETDGLLFVVSDYAVEAPPTGHSALLNSNLCPY
ncbi:MAG: hypothetical protein LBR06_09015 [Bacteroidales bacterium]|nr:hypothetical protein [Bacteroidales bacterium]